MNNRNILDGPEFYTAVLPAARPREESKTRPDKAKRRADVYLEYPKDGTGICQECGKEASVYDRRENRVWRYLDICTYQTHLHCRIPGTRCGEHGIKTAEIPRPEDRCHFTKQFGTAAIDVPQAAKNRSRTGKPLAISRDGINGITRRAAERGLPLRGEAEIMYLGIDGKSFLSGQNYAAVPADTADRRVLEAVQNRDEKAAKEALQSLSEGQRGKVKAVSMYFRQAYKSAAGSGLSSAKTVRDKFHITKYIHEAVNHARAGEQRRKKEQNGAALTGTKYLWLKKPENFTGKDRKRRAELKPDQMETGRARNLKELFSGYWNCENITSARKMFKNRYNSAVHSGLEPAAKAAETVKSHFENIISRRRHHITNSCAEGINSVIQEINNPRRRALNLTRKITPANDGRQARY